MEWYHADLEKRHEALRAVPPRFKGRNIRDKIPECGANANGEDRKMAEWLADDVSSFPWRYTTTEVAYIVEGEADIVPNDGRKRVTARPGDVVTLPKGLSCTWYIKGKLKKRYKYVTDSNAYAYTNMHNDHPTVGSVHTGIPEILGAVDVNEHREFRGILEDERKF
eukprot:CAMPEP_0185273236 /NCGR_PEP_ID=MMETSP1359-20130426/49043_1 /TAXON_ID=552665 /ORGANISM="Bigelowiella longifila, Strain CCMP242" /LENGTH=165 /DNA_ID=CAMNT_0027865789 /DNA_START=324 /DNA_END=822 /DNA_ORIENTATION=-